MTLKNGQDFLTASTIQIPPTDDEIELSVFGRGFGECIILCCGHKEFVVIDSFINSKTKNPIALDYLNAIGVGIAGIKEVAITHWHQDHIAGISKILNHADFNAKIIINPIIKQEKFNEYISCAIAEGNSSTTEFAEVYKFLLKTGLHNIIIPTQHARVYSNEKLQNAEIYTLSPQDSEIASYINNLRMNYEDKKTTYSLPDDNFLSLVMLLKNSNDGILLGGDLENSKDEDSGWNAIVNNYEHTNTRPSVFKVPHHGSDTGYNDRVWKEILDNLPISILSVYNKGNKLPTDNEVERLLSLSKSLYIVGNKNKTNKKLERIIMKSRFGKSITPISTDIGLVRYRKDLKSGETKIECFGAAKEMSK